VRTGRESFSHLPRACGREQALSRGGARVESRVQSVRRVKRVLGESHLVSSPRRGSVSGEVENSCSEKIWRQGTTERLSKLITVRIRARAMGTWQQLHERPVDTVAGGDETACLRECKRSSR
jgi:hypothetical protein